MKRFLLGLSALLLFAAIVPCSAQESDKDVPWKALAEIARRGDHVELVAGFEGENDPVGDVLEPPADDSHKFFFTIVSTKNCQFCDMLRADFENSPWLKAWVDTKDYKKSWAHYQVIDIADQTQAWRWKNLKPTKFPTLIVQPPYNGSWGDPHTVVYMKEGYSKPEVLDKAIRNAISQYATKVHPKHVSWKATRAATEGLSAEKTEGGAEQSGPPFTPPSPLAPTPSYPSYPSGPLPMPVGPAVPDVAPNLGGLGALLMQFLTSLISGQGMANLLLVLLIVVNALTFFAPKTETKLDDQALVLFKSLLDKLKNEKKPPDSPASSG